MRQRAHRSALLAAALLAVLACSGVQAATAGAQSTSLAAWGANQDGQLGNGTEVGSDVPVLTAPELTELAGIASGEHDSFARLASNTLEGWGANEFGQLGDGTMSGPQTCLTGFACSTTPIAVDSLTGIKEVVAGANFGLALTGSSTVMAWGQNTSGQLGDGNTESRDEPVEVKGLTGVLAIAAGNSDGYALLSNGEVKAWGANESGQLGIGSTSTPHDEAVTVKGLTNVLSIAAGANHALARRSAGVVAWGANESGQLGDDSTTQSDEAVAVIGIPLAPKAVAAGGNHSLALLSNGTVRAWGANEFGQLGLGSTSPSDEATEVKGLSTASAIAAGANHSVALLGTGVVEAWGDNESGQLGIGSPANSSVPAPVDALSGVTTIAAGGNQSLAVGTLAAIPTITKLEPNFGYAGGSQTVTITGTNLTEVTEVKFGAKPADSFNIQSENEIIATSPPGTGVVPVTASTSGATSPLTSADQYTYGPTAVSLQPNRGLPVGGTQVTVEGTGFHNVSAVKFGGANASSFKVVSEHEIVATSPAAVTGPVNVTVTNPDGTSPTTSANQFLYTEPRWYRNLVVTGTAHVPMVGYGHIALSSTHNELTAECVALMFGSIWNEREGGSAHGYGQILSFFASGHAPSSQHPELSSNCRLTSHGVIAKGDGWLTPEAPIHETQKQGEVCIDRQKTLAECPIKAGETGAEREITNVVTEVSREALSLPWNVVLVPKEGRILVRIGAPSEKSQSCSEKPAPPGCLRLTAVAPALGLQVPFEGALEPQLVIGDGSGLSPSTLEFEGEKSGILSSPLSEFAGGTTTGAIKIVGLSAMELDSAE